MQQGLGGRPVRIIRPLGHDESCFLLCCLLLSALVWVSSAHFCCRCPRAMSPSPSSFFSVCMPSVLSKSNSPVVYPSRTIRLCVDFRSVSQFGAPVAQHRGEARKDATRKEKRCQNLLPTAATTTTAATATATTQKQRGANDNIIIIDSCNNNNSSINNELRYVDCRFVCWTICRCPLDWIVLQISVPLTPLLSFMSQFQTHTQE